MTYMDVFIVAVIIAVIGLVGSCDYDDAVVAEDHYSEMVCAGAWPDYQHLKPDCTIPPPGVY